MLPLRAAFDCTHEVRPADLNRVQWEAKAPAGTSICVKDVRIVRASPAPPVSPAAAASADAAARVGGLAASGGAAGQGGSGR